MSSNSALTKITNELLQTFDWDNKLSLRPYQLEGATWLLSCYNDSRGCILSDEMGLGKTCQVIAMLTVIKGQTCCNSPHLVVCPRSVVENWLQEFLRFSPSLNVITYVGNKDERQDIAEMVKVSHKGSAQKFDVLLTTYELCLKDASFLSSISWDTLVVDEGHRLKNSESLLHQTLQEWTVKVHILLTGTPVQNNLKELYSLLNFVDKSRFQLFAAGKFVAKYSSEDVQELHHLLTPYLMRRTKAMVLPDLPDKSDVLLYHSLSSLQKRLYKAILLKDISAFYNTDKSNQTSLRNILMQLRKCTIHPYLFDNVEPEPFELGEHLVSSSHKLMLLDQLLSFLKSGGHKVLIFSQMTSVLDILQDYLGYRGYIYERLDGSVRGEERFLAVQNFNANDETFVFLLSTKAGGQGLNLISADTVIFMDSDFNPQNDLQAAARAHRIGQERPVRIIRLIARNTVEEIILTRAESKLKLTEKVIETGAFATKSEDKPSFLKNGKELQEILKFGLDKLFVEDQFDEDINFQSILGTSENGCWTSALEKEIKREITEEAFKEKMSEEKSVPQSMYVFEGTDYSRMPSASDVKAFEQLIIEEQKSLEDERATSSDEVTGLQNIPSTSRRRAKEKQEQAEILLQKTKENKVKSPTKVQKKRESIWRAHGYVSANVELKEIEGNQSVSSPGNGAGDDEIGLGTNTAIHYVRGDVTQPVDAKTKHNIIVMCANDSGKWGKGGLFSAISARSKKPKKIYKLAAEMKDLAMGHCHLIPLDDVKKRDDGQDLLALIIAQKWGKTHQMSRINISSLGKCLRKVYQVASEKKASIHLPRIGYDTPGFNWYGTERSIQKNLASKGIPTYIYYCPRNQAGKRKHKKQQGAANASSYTSADDNQVTKKAKLSESANTSATMLPSLFSGVAVYFFNIDVDVKKNLTRYLIAYDGDIEKSMNISTTHLVTPPNTNKMQLNDVVKNFQCRVVTPEWLIESVNKGKLLPTDDFLVSLM